MPIFPAILAVVWAVLLFGGLLLGQSEPGRLGRIPRWARLGSSLALALAAWAWALENGWNVIAILVALGMALGLRGDILLSGVTPLKKPLPAAMAAFGLGHVMYCAALLLLGAGLGASPTIGVFPWLAYLTIGVGGWYLAVQRGHPREVLRLTALPYALLLASTAGLAAGLAVQSPAVWPAAIGGSLFLFSDLMVAVQRFSGVRFPAMDDVVWLTYGPGQALIVFGVNAVLRT